MRIASLWMLGLFLAAQVRALDSVQIRLDEAGGTLTCANKTTDPPVCVATAASGSPVSIVITGLPSFVKATIKTTEVHAAENGNFLNNLITGGTTTKDKETLNKGFDLGGLRALPTEKSPAKLFEIVTRDVDSIRDVVATGLTERYPELRSYLHASIAALLDALKLDQDIEKQLKDAGANLPPNFADWWKSVLAIDRSPSGFASAVQTFDLEDDTNVAITFDIDDSVKAAVTTPPPGAVANVVIKDWRILTSSGLAGSHLVDDHYTVRTIVDTPATDTKAAVTHREAVREERDLANAEATYFVQIAYARDRRLKIWPPDISVGVGVGTGISGRIYFGPSWMLGSRASLAIGGALGQVKRLSRNVDVKNLGADVDPEATRRTVTRLAPFVGLSWRLPR